MSYTLSIESAQHTSAGQKSENQDFHGMVVPTNYHLESKGITVAIADGVSTSAAGREAAESSVNGFLSDYYSTPESWTVKTSVSKVLNSINRWLFSQGQSAVAPHQGHVTTFSGLILKSTTAHIFHSGDSRIYLYRGKQLEQLTRDHRVYISEKEHYLNRALGIDLHLDIDYKTKRVEVGDLFLFTTDGIHDFVDARTLQSLLDQTQRTLPETAEAIVETALKQQSTDNLTCQLLRVTALPDPNAEEFYQRLTRLPFPPELSTGVILDGYKVVREMHAGKRSQCYLAVDVESEESVVIKTPSVNYEDDPEYIRNFLQEEWIGKQINNPHVGKVVEFKRPRKFLYQLTEYTDCKTLGLWLNDNPRPDLDQVRSIIEQVAKGLRALHKLEIIHRDLKPDNLIIDRDGWVRIIDFGSAKISGETETLLPIDLSNLVGTLDYTAPEFLSGNSGSPQSDQYALAVLTYELLSGGALPYSKPLASPQRPPSRYLPLATRGVDVPVWVEGAIQRALNPDPNKRYQDILEYTFDLAHPNSAYVHDDFVPLMERNPLKFWKIFSFSLLLVNIVLVFLLLRPR